MSSRYTVRSFSKNCVYHAYNRGVEKRDIFLDESDCRIFLFYLKLYLSPIEALKTQKIPGLRLDKILKNNLSEETDLLSYALMPNHFHLLIKQKTTNGTTKLMKRMSVAYAMYFNKKYNRVGPLFQGIYKSVLITTDEQMLHVSRYIHLNAFEIKSNIDFKKFSSYAWYLNANPPSWIHPDIITEYFRSVKKISNNDMLSYQSFVEDHTQPSKELLGELTLED